MKITEIRFHQNYSEENQVIETGKVEGDFNLLSPMFNKIKKSKDRQKLSYIYRVEDAPANYYSFNNLEDSEYEFAKKTIPNFGKTW